MLRMPAQKEIDAFATFLDQQKAFLADTKNWQKLTTAELVRVVTVDLEASAKAVRLVREHMTKLAELEIRAVRAETALADRADTSVPPI